MKRDYESDTKKRTAKELDTNNLAKFYEFLNNHVKVIKGKKC
jgi:hypothetical protein